MTSNSVLSFLFASKQDRDAKTDSVENTARARIQQQFLGSN